MKKILWPVWIVLLGLLLPGICSARTFTENGYKISLQWRQSNDLFIVKGEIKAGKVCRMLDVSISFKNLGDSTGIANIKTPITYHNTNGENFYIQEEIDFNNEYRNKWVVDSIDLKCH